jgi:hypothetical protein
VVEKAICISFYVAAVVKPAERVFSASVLALRHMASMALAAPWGVGANRRQRPSLRVGANARHPMLSASFDESGKACGRRPPLSDGFLARPGKATGRLHQPHNRGVTPHRHTASASVRTAPAGNTPVARNLPKGNQYLARHRHYPTTPQALPTGTTAFCTPATQGPLRLRTPPTPRSLQGHPAPVSVP